MKRLLGLLAGASLALAIGCAQPYDVRISDTIEWLKYKRDLGKNTEQPPAGSSSLGTAKVYIRAPKGLAMAKTFGFVLEPGKFDSSESFLASEKQTSLHILARSNAPKATTKKAPGPPGAPPKQPGEEPPPQAVRAEFTADVLDFIKAAYSTDLEASQLKDYKAPSHGRSSVPYKRAVLDLGDKQVQVYFHGDKNSPAQVALVFEGTKDALSKISTQIDYSLTSLRIGPAATNLYNGGDEMSGEEAQAPAGVF